MILSQPDSWQHHPVSEDTMSTDPCISPRNLVSEGSTASTEYTVDRTRDKPITNDKDHNMKHHDHASSTIRRGRKRSATNRDQPTRTWDQHPLSSQQLMTVQNDHTIDHPGTGQGQNHTMERARIIPSHPTSSHPNVAMTLSPTTPIAKSPSILTASDMNTEQDQYHTTHSEQNHLTSQYSRF